MLSIHNYAKFLFLFIYIDHKRISKYNNITFDVGYSVAGVQFGYQCFCGSSYAHAERRPEEHCNMRCLGDRSKMCGGGNLMNVYDTNLGEFQ